MSLPASQAQEQSDIQLLESLSNSLQPVSRTELESATARTLEDLYQLQQDLSEQAIGVILSKELQIDKIGVELRKDTPDASFLRTIEQSLRRTTPGKSQLSIDALRKSVGYLARLHSTAPADIVTLHQSIDTIRRHINDLNLRKTFAGEFELRNAFDVLSKFHRSMQDVQTLQQRLSAANYVSLIKSEYLKSLSRNSFELPIHFQKCEEGTRVEGNGTVRVSLALDLPLSYGESKLRVNALGTGDINISANRRRIHATVRLSPKVRGQQLLHIRPESISGDSPVVVANLSSQLTSISQNGLLGRFELFEKFASRVVKKLLEANDETLADQLEQSAQQRIEEEGFILAYRINSLIRHNWSDRIRSLDFTPTVLLQNHSYGIETDATILSPFQLGALSPRPNVPTDIFQQLDHITWLHESAINNILDRFGGLRLDEPTVRGLWETEFKLTSDNWSLLPPARVPGAIALAEQKPIQVRFVTNGIEIQLRAKSCEVDGRIEADGAQEIAIHYQLIHDSNGIHLSRKSISFADEIPAESLAVWLKTIDLFFGETIRPMPKFRTSSLSSLLRLGYLNVDGGWLVFGTVRATPQSEALVPNANNEDLQ